MKTWIPLINKGDPGFLVSFPFDTAKRILNIYDYVWCFVVF